MNKTYITNLETSKIELHFSKEEYQALTVEQQKEIKGAYLFSRYANAWVSRSKNNHYRAIKVAESLGFVKGETIGERLSFEEELNKKAGKAERKIERCETYSTNAERRAENLQSDFNKMRGDISFLTQPNIASAGGRSFTNYRNKIMNRYEKGFSEYRKSEYFKEKAESMQNTANKTKLKDKNYLYNKIEECKKTIKKYEGYIVVAEEKQLNGDIESETKIKQYLTEIEYQIDKQGFLENCLDKLGGVQYSKENIKKGYNVKIRGTWGEVLKANKKTLEYKIIEGGASGMVLKYTYAEIQEIKIPEGFENKKDEIKNPYKVNDLLVHYNVSGNRIITAYQVLKVTPKGIQIRKIEVNNNKPIKDSFISEKPKRKKIVESKYSDFIGVYDGDWQLHKYAI